MVSYLQRRELNYKVHDSYYLKSLSRIFCFILRSSNLVFIGVNDCSCPQNILIIYCGDTKYLHKTTLMKQQRITHIFCRVRGIKLTIVSDVTIDNSMKFILPNIGICICHNFLEVSDDVQYSVKLFTYFILHNFLYKP